MTHRPDRCCVQNCTKTKELISLIYVDQFRGSLGSFDGWDAKTRWTAIFASAVLQLWCPNLCKRTVPGTWKVFVYPSAPLQAEYHSKSHLKFLICGLLKVINWNYCRYTSCALYLTWGAGFLLAIARLAANSKTWISREGPIAEVAEELFK